MKKGGQYYVFPILLSFPVAKQGIQSICFPTKMRPLLLGEAGAARFSKANRGCVGVSKQLCVHPLFAFESLAAPAPPGSGGCILGGKQMHWIPCFPRVQGTLSASGFPGRQGIGFCQPAPPGSPGCRGLAFASQRPRDPRQEGEFLGLYSGFEKPPQSVYFLRRPKVPRYRYLLPRDLWSVDAARTS